MRADLEGFVEYYLIMLIKEQDKAMVVPRPRSFAALMELYEINYIQLRLLLGDLQNLPKEKTSYIKNHLPVFLKVEESTKHTTTFLLTYIFSESDSFTDSRPDLLVRVYHDAQQAEVINHRCRFTGETVPRWQKDIENNLLCRWRVNRFLYKWIKHLQYYKYKF